MLTDTKEVVMPTGLSVHMSTHTRVHVRHKTSCVDEVGLAHRMAGVWEANLPSEVGDTFSAPSAAELLCGAALPNPLYSGFQKIKAPGRSCLPLRGKMEQY